MHAEALIPASHQIFGFRIRLFTTSQRLDVDVQPGVHVYPASTSLCLCVSGALVGQFRFDFEQVVAANIGPRKREMIRRHAVVLRQVLHIFDGCLNIKTRAPG